MLVVHSRYPNRHLMLVECSNLELVECLLDVKFGLLEADFFEQLRKTWKYYLPLILFLLEILLRTKSYARNSNDGIQINFFCGH